MKIKKRKFNKAFSLAESMIVLVVVSIILGVSAPLVARHFSKGTNSVVSVSGLSNNISVAQGNNTFQVGDEKNPPGADDNKLEVYGGIAIKNTKAPIISKDGNTTSIEVTCNPLWCNRLEFLNSSNNAYIDLTVGTYAKNILSRGTPPIYIYNDVYINSNCNSHVNKIYCSVPSDGYLLISNALHGYEITNDRPENVQDISKTNENDSALFRSYAYRTTKDNVFHFLPTIVPITRTQYYHCNNNCVFIPVNKIE